MFFSNFWKQIRFASTMEDLPANPLRYQAMAATICIPWVITLAVGTSWCLKFLGSVP